MPYIDDTERIGNLIVQVMADEDPMSPRDADTFTEIYGHHPHYVIGDGEPPSEHLAVLERGGLRMLYRFMRRFGDPRDGSKLLAMRQLAMYDHSGVTYWTEEIGSRRPYMFDPGGWDTSHVGYVIITQKRWDYMGGGDPEEVVDGERAVGLGRLPTKERRADHILEVEVEEYDDWAKGNVWGFVITKPHDDPEHEDEEDDAIVRCPHSETVESIWGFIGDPKYAWEEARATAAAINA